MNEIDSILFRVRTNSHSVRSGTVFYRDTAILGYVLQNNQ